MTHNSCYRKYLVKNKEALQSDVFINKERFADKWHWLYLSANNDMKKLFNNWAKQEISTALGMIRSAKNL